MLRFLHRWMGVFLSLLLILVSLTGVALIWKDVYLGITIGGSDQSRSHDINSLSTLALNAEQHFGVDTILRIDFGTEQNAIGKVFLLNKRAAYISTDGDLLASWGENTRLEDGLLDLHHRLFSGTVGLYIVGVSGIATLLLVLTGLIVYWPARKTWSLGFSLRSFKRLALLNAHRNTGVVLAIPIFLVVFSGVVLSFPDISRSVFLAAYIDDDHYGEDFGDGVDDRMGVEQATWPRAIARAAEVFPDGQITGLIWPQGTGTKQIRVRNSGEWSERGNSVVHINEVDGYMDIRIDARTLPFGERALYLMQVLHRSALGGRFYDVFLSFVGLGLVYLGVIGLLSFVKGRKKPYRNKHRA